jgi:cytoskeletal protein CcmA (bactofilin family)
LGEPSPDSRFSGRIVDVALFSKKGRRGGQSREVNAEHTVLDTVSTVFRPSDKEASMFGDKGHGDDGGQPSTSLGKGSQVTGKLSFEGTVRIDGQVDGEISAQESVVIGETAIVKAQVTADSVVVIGTVTGDITARRRVEIRAPGKLYGNITTPSLVIHDGVVFEGHCSMQGTEAQKGMQFGGGDTIKDEKVTAFPNEDRDPGAVNLKQSEMRW